MYISYSSSEVYAPHTGISIFSLLDNNQDSEFIHIFLLDLGMSDVSKAKIRGIVESFGRSITIMNVDNDTIRRTVGANVPAHFGSLATYARLCGAVLYPEEVHRIIFVDSDMIIRGSLKSIYEVELGDCIVGAIPGRNVFGENEVNNPEEKEIGHRHKFYVNCGLLLVDLDNWKKSNFSEKIRQAAAQLKLFTFKDQTILNAALDDKFLYRLPCKYNYPFHANPRYLIKEWSLNYPQLSQSEIYEAAKDPVVIHYVGEQCRPWYKENISCMADEYYRYKAKSPFNDVPLQSIFDTPKYKKASVVQKLFLRLMFSTYQSYIGYPLYYMNQKRLKNKKRR